MSACNKRRKALRCGTFQSSSSEERHFVTGDFGGSLAIWDLEEAGEPVEEVTGAHGEGLINCVTGDRGAGVVVSAGRDGQVRMWDR